jgi:putative nucleotidyltransferase with HDIG domain
LKPVIKFFRDKHIPAFFSALLVGLAIFGALVLPISLRPKPSILNVGDVAFQDIRAPRNFSFESDVLTDQARNEAETAVPPVYLPADPSISRKQIEKLRNILGFIHSVRQDQFASSTQKINDLTAISDVQLTQEIAKNMLSQEDNRWEALQTESIFLLEEVMKASIRDDQVASVRRNLYPQIGFEFDSTETEIIGTLVSQLISANSLFSNESTAMVIDEVRAKVAPVLRQFRAGEIIVSSGAVIAPLDYEALQEFGFTEQRNRFTDYLSAALVVIVVMTFNLLYLRRIRRSTGQSVYHLPTIIALFLVFLYIARFIIPNHTILPYLFPVAAFSLTVSSLISHQTGLIASLSLSLLVAFNEPSFLDLSLYYFLPSAIAIFVLGRGRRITIFFLAGFAIAVSGSMVIIAYRLLTSFLDLAGASTLIGASFVNGLGSVSITVILQYVLAQMLGKTTALQLMDLSRPDHPLLQELLLKAPGTYQHSLQVANLAEQAAKEINADPLLTRVGALYHDIGKVENPTFFIENQPPAQIDTHDNLDPVIASSTIIQHVKDGLSLGRKYHLPPQILAFINEHHGTSITRYQYDKALEKTDKPDQINRELFRYPGVSPQSRETALLMLADGCEARVKAEIPLEPDDIERIVNENIKFALNQGQLDHTELTLNDLRIVARSFTRTLQNTYHHRVIYPKMETPERLLESD